MVFYQLSYLILWVPFLERPLTILNLHMEEASCTFCLPDVSCQHLTCIRYIFTKRDHLTENILQNHGFSRLMYLMTFRHRCIWAYMNLTHE